MSINEESLYETVHLEPFIHQVGGRSSMLHLDQFTLCKPLIEEEQRFYENIPPELKPFTPDYRGTVSVEMSEDAEGYLTLTAYPSTQVGSVCRRASLSANSTTESSIPMETLLNLKPKKYRMRLLQRSQSIELEPVEMGLSQGPLFDDEDEHSPPTQHNPWIIRCHDAQVRKFLANRANKFILLENLTSRFEYPCILDIKMGIRQYGDEANDEKRRSLDAKTAATTSASLGLRITGMQVYREDTGHYLCHNKYFGRSLDQQGFWSTFESFFNNGVVLRKDVIAALLKKISQLEVVVARLDGYRFYTSSLLVLYEGKRFVKGSNGMLTDTALVDARMIDFAHSTKSPSQEGPDEGYLFGLRNLKSCLESLLGGGVCDTGSNSIS